ncbi:MAG: penicillin-binding protein 2 [Actinobacteria bacterium]|nr:penicillin-binding protein 2 [Actinomycetota bacterium]
MYLEPMRKRRAPSDDTSVAARLAVLAAAAVILFAVLLFRLWFLQILSGDWYSTQADDQRLRTVSISAPRGVVYDRDGEPLVVNRAGLSVGILPMDLRSPEMVIPRLAEVLGMPEDEIWQKLEKGKSDPYRVTVIQADVPENPVVSYLKEHSLEFPGVRIEKSYLRSYPRQAFATHILGYVGEVSYDDLEKEQFRTLGPGAMVGKDGVEAVYDSKLRGVDGTRTVEVDAAGRPRRMIQEIQPQPGSNLVLTLDNELQDVAELAVVEGIERAHQEGFTDAAAGAIVALDPRTGEILAMASYPDYDLTSWVGGMKTDTYRDLTSPEGNKPFFDRAIKGLYPAASVFKPFVAAAALRNDVVDWTTVFNDPGSFKIGAQRWKCWKDDGHGDVNLVEALMVSCDTYFYNIGSMFYDMEGPIFQDGLEEFGFGRASGIDLLGEAAGRVPDKDWKRETGKSEEERLWKPGDDVNLSIGQGDLLVTPLQLAVASAALANGGDVLVPRIVRQITDGSGNVIKEFETEMRGRVELHPEELESIRRGLRLVTSDPNGTGYGAFRGFPIAVAGKTGTAERPPDDDYAWFMGYAPASAPEILVVAIIEKGGHGSSVAAPVVRRVLDQYFHTESAGPTQVEVTE